MEVSSFIVVGYDGPGTAWRISMNLTRTGDSPVRGSVLVRWPDYIDPTHQKSMTQMFDLGEMKKVVLTSDVMVPDGTPEGVYLSTVEAYVRDKKVLAGQAAITVGKPAVPAYDSLLRLGDVTRTSAAITWQSPTAGPSTVTVTRALPGRELVWNDAPKASMIKPVPGAKPMVFQDKTAVSGADGAVHMRGFTIVGLEPGKRYMVTVSPAENGKESEALDFYTAPPAGKTEFIHMKVANVIFTNVTNKPDAARDGAKVAASKEEVDRIKRECQMATMFYWINSGMRLWMDNDFYVTDKYYEVDNTPYGVGYTGPEVPAMKELIEAAGKKVSDYDDRNFISLEKRWDEKTGKWFYPSSGGGTYGPEGEPGYGVSAWKAGGQNYWLYTHEDGHQIDALYGWSMGPEYIFNHPQPWDGSAHRHGEHFDANSWLVREWAGYYTREHQGPPMLEPRTWFRWFTNRWGTVEFADDKDEDGIPDNAPQVPLDEVRWKSDPDKKDTDGDSLTDMREAMACAWVDYGLSEIWQGPISKHRCDPNNKDTDGDGIVDGKDLYPLYPWNFSIGGRTASVDGVVSDGEYKPFAKIDDQAYKADVFLAWDADNLYIAMKSDKTPETARIYLDFGDDGWFIGKNNCDIRITPAGNIKVGAQWHTNPEKTFGAALHNCGVPGKWPFYDPDGLKDGEVKFAQSTEGGYSFELAIPKDLGNGVRLVKGQKIGLLFAVGPVGGSGRQEEIGQITLFEPHTLPAFELVR
jgi:hypothetical protein